MQFVLLYLGQLQEYTSPVDTARSEESDVDGKKLVGYLRASGLAAGLSDEPLQR